MPGGQICWTTWHLQKRKKGRCRKFSPPHFGEEAPLVGSHGSGTIFFSHCNLLCRFCQNFEIRHLVLPENAAGTREVMAFLAKKISPRTYVNIIA